MQGPYFTVTEIAEHLSRASPGEVAARYFARQIRHWSYRGLFGPLPSRGVWNSAPQLLEAHHYVEARIFGALTELGFTVSDLHLVRACFENRPAGIDAPRQAWLGTRSVLESFRSGQTDWRCLVFTNDDGKIGGGAFARNSAVPEFLKAANPVLIILNERVLFDGLPNPIEHG
jgi:hypothetical protein